MLNTTNGTYRPDDLLEHTLFFNDGNDGTFSPGDFMLFYAKGSDRIVWNNQHFSHVNHLYADSSFCFIGIGSGGVNLIDTVNHLNQTYSAEVNEFWDFDYINDDRVNLLKSGSIWLGDVFDLTNQYDYSFPFTSLGDSSFVKIRVVSKSTSSPASFNLSLFGQNRNISINGSGSSYLSDAGRSSVNEYYFLNTTNSNFNMTLTYNNNGSPSSKGYLDYVEVNCKRQLSVDKSAFDFRITNNIPTWSKINLQNSNSVQMVWDITDLTNVKSLAFQQNGVALYFIDEIDSVKHYTTISGNAFPAPSFIQKVVSQNLHGLSTPDMIIITNGNFMQAADELKLFHESDGLLVHIVTDQQIFNEFSSQ